MFGQRQGFNSFRNNFQRKSSQSTTALLNSNPVFRLLFQPTVVLLPHFQQNKASLAECTPQQSYVS